MSADYPDDRLYHREALWLRPLADGEALIGVNHHAQKSLGEIVFLDLPRVGVVLRIDTPLGTIESHKAVSDMISPASGKVLLTNPRVRGEPALVNRDPYGEGWILRLRLTEPEEGGKLLAAKDYVAQLASCG